MLLYFYLAKITCSIIELETEKGKTMKRSMFVLIAAAAIVYGIVRLVKAIWAIVRYVRIQRIIDKTMDLIMTDEYQESVNAQAAKVMESLGL